MKPEALEYCEKQIKRIAELEAEVASLRVDAERYRWLRDAKRLTLQTDGSKWIDENGVPFINSHYLAAFDHAFGAAPTLDAAIDAARKP